MLYRKGIKRVLDFIISLGGLLILSPLFLLITLLQTFSCKGKPFFLQKRVGKGNRIFNIIKFRTMNEKSDSEGKLLSDIQRITKTGAFLRKSSLDELPNLLNVLIGNMSLIGPRPLLVDYLPVYSQEQIRRHNVKPGISGWAQVNGRNSISWTEKFKLDVWYVDNISFCLDLKIFFLTLKKVLSTKGVNSSEDEIVEWFTGDN